MSGARRSRVCCGPHRLTALQLLLALLFVFGSLSASAQSASPIQLVTIDPGQIYWQRFGHNMLIVPSADGSEPLSYNFGYFDFEQPDFFTRFLRGRMLYQALAIPVNEDLSTYVDERRSVHAQTLALTADQATQLDRLLRSAVEPEHRDYLYEYFRANCSTRVRDLLDQALDGQIRQQTANRSRGHTYRMHAMRLAQQDFWLSAGIDLGLGPDTDRPLSFWDEMFIPELMRQHLRGVSTADGAPLIMSESTWFESDEASAPILPPDRRIPFAACGIAVAVLLLWLSRRNSPPARKALRWSAALLHLFFGLTGAVLLFLWLGTDHVAAHRNENLLLLSPLSLLLVPFWLRSHRLSRDTQRIGNVLASIVAILAACALLAKTLPTVFIQANLHWILLILPIQIALYVAWRAISVTGTARVN